MGLAMLYYAFQRKPRDIETGSAEGEPDNGGNWLNPVSVPVTPRPDTKWGVIGIYDTEQNRVILDEVIAQLNFFVQSENLPGGYQKIKSAIQMRNTDYPPALLREVFPEVESGAYPKVYLVRPDKQAVHHDIVKTFAYATGNMDTSKIYQLKQGILRFFGR